ncbi:MAG: GtrA family protein [Solirubrobacterales bacterium]|jgi:dolichol-phosphate mannosyltransferase|nr:GtrA family protein [Solirubrobacterales bacterium]
MHDEGAATLELRRPAPAPARTRVRQGLSTPGNWAQLVRFAVVGGSGVVVNLAVYAALVTGASVDYRLAATVAFLIAVGNNFTWNRLWTFRARNGHAGFQAARFLVVSVGAFLLNLAVLELLVAVVGVGEVPAQAIAIATATPANFLGNKLWSFRGQSGGGTRR